MRKLAMALAAVTLFAVATPASAQGVYVDGGYGYYGGRGSWGGREVYAYRPYYRQRFYRRHYEPDYYPQRSWWGGY